MLFVGVTALAGYRPPPWGQLNKGPEAPDLMVLKDLGVLEMDIAAFVDV